MIQNQHGARNIAKKWDKIGLVLENLGYNKYLIKVDGSGRVTDRNRQFLRQFTPVTSTLPGPRPSDSYVPDPVVQPEYQRPIEPEPVVQQYRPVQIIPDMIPEPPIPSTPKPVMPPEPTSPSTPESPSFVTPPTTPVAAEPPVAPEAPRRSSRINKGVPPERLNYSKF